MSSDSKKHMQRINSVPIVQSIMKNHAENIRKMEKTQFFTKVILKSTQNKRIAYTEHEAKTQQARQSVMLTRKIKAIQKLKKKSEEDFSKIFRKLNEIEEKKEKERQKTILNRERKMFQSSYYREEAEKTLKAKIHNSLKSSTLDRFQDNYLRTFHKNMGDSLKIMSDLSTKQNKAQQNRKSLMMSTSIHETNEKKLEKNLKVRQQLQHETDIKLNKFVSKIVSFIGREQEIQAAIVKQSESKRKSSGQKTHKIHIMRENNEHRLSQKFNELEQKLIARNQRSMQNKQNMSLQKLNDKKLKRMEREQKNLNKFKKNHKEFQEKMMTMYKKDKEHWNFLTTVASFQSELIEKNVYESNQVAHRN